MALVIVHRVRSNSHQDIWYFIENEQGALSYRGKRLHCILLYSTEDFAGARIDLARDPLAWKREERDFDTKTNARERIAHLFEGNDAQYVAAAREMLNQAEVVDYDSFVQEVSYGRPEDVS